MLAASAAQAQQDLPTVWLGFDGPSDVEEGDTIRFRIFRDSVGMASALKGVAININPEGGSYLKVGEIGSLCPGYEHYLQDRCFTIPAGRESLTVDIPTYATTSFEKDTRIFLGVRGGLPQYHYRNHYIQGNPKSIHATVRDGPDIPEFQPDTVTLSVLDARAAEGNPNDDALLHLRLTRDGSSGLTAGESLRVPLVFSGGQPGTDFTLSMLGASTGVALDAGTGTVTFTGSASGRGASEAFLALAASDDANAEDETVTVEIPVPVASGTARGVEGRRKGDGRIVLVDDDDAALPEVTVSADASPVAEGEDAVFTITADPAPESPLAVRVTVAQEGDYGVTTGSRTVTVPASGSRKLSLPTQDDAVDEADGSVTVTVASGNGYAAGSPAAGSVTIVDDDAAADPVTVSLAAKRDSIAEENGETKFTISLSRALVAGETVTAPFTVTGGQANAHWNVAFHAGDNGAGVERTAAGAHSEVRFTAGGQTATLVLIGRPDADTADRVITIAFGTGARAPSATGVAGGIVLGTSSFDVTIVDDDVALPEVTIAADAGSVGEGGDASFTLTASPPPSGPLAVNVTVAASGDYGVTAGSRTVTIPASGSKKLILPTDDDAVDEADGSVTATVDSGTDYTVGSASSGTVSILDDDDAPLPEVTITADAGSVGEGGDASFTLTASPPPSGPLAVDVTVAAEGDYGVTAGSRTVTMPASGSKKLILPTDDDAVDEADGSVTVTVDSGTGYTVGSASSATVSILDDDDAPLPEVTIAADAGSVGEGGDASFTLTASPPPSGPLAVDVTVAAQGDYGVTAGSRTVTMPASGSKKLILPTDDDAVDEADGSVTVTLGSGDGYATGSASTATMTIVDDDAAAWEPKQEVVDSVKTVIAKHVPTAQGGTGNYGAWARLHRVLGGILGEDQIARYPGTDNKGRTHAEQTYQPFTAAECRAEARKFAVTNIWKPWCDEIARREQWEASAGTAGDRAPAAVPAVDAEAGALALLEGVTPETATAALYDGRVLDDARLDALDLLGNANGSYDLGDLLAWIAHCRRDAARCGGTGTSTDGGSGPAAGLAPLGAGFAIRRRGRRRRGRARKRERTAGRRAARRPRITVLALALAAAVWGCDAGRPGSPTEPTAPTGPGLLEVRVAVPAGARAAGAMLVVEGPGIDSVEPSAPGLELVHLGGAPDRREVIVAGELAAGTLLRIGVPDTGNRARYRVTVVQVAGGDYELMDPAGFEVALAR